MDRIGIHIIIRGRVQAVGYRAWLADAAKARGLSGWCRNLSTGEVEAVLSGPPDDVHAVRQACMTGPGWAKVIAVDIVSDADPVEGGFAIVASA